MPTKTTQTPKVTSAIKARNERYKKATQAGKRIMLAKEVLRLIKIGTLEPTRGIYLSTDIPSDLDTTQNAQPYVASGAIQCEVCAKGALFVAAVSIRNRLKLEDISEDWKMNGLIRNEAHEDDTFGLVKLFGPRITCAIEQCFENHHGSPSATTALQSIMRNIIKNKGNFLKETL